MKNIEVTGIPVGSPDYPTNCWLIVNKKSRERIVVDPGFEAEKIKDAIEKAGAVPVAVLLTHGHFDHIMACEEIRKTYRVSLYTGEHDVPFLTNPEWNLSLERTGTAMAPVPDVLVRDGQNILLAGIDIKYIHTPGHTYGSGCYYIPDEKVLISGDTIFYYRHGKTLSPTGSDEDMRNSLINKLMILPDDTDVFCGHEGDTTIGKVKPYFEEEYGVKL